MRLLLVFIITFKFSLFSFAQCVPNPIFTSFGVPGVYPPEVPIPNIPLTGIVDGTENFPYDQTLTVIILQDTTLDIAFLLPSAVVTAMNFAGISTTMNVGVNHVRYSVTGLPNGLSYQCDLANCEYGSGVIGCILLDGTPIESGNFTVSINTIININIPPIQDPILGSTLFAGMDIDLPSFAAPEYNLFINAPANVNEKNILSPNPSFSNSYLYLNNESSVYIYNILGKELAVYKKIKGKLLIDKTEFGSGVFFINIHNNLGIQQKRLIIK